MTLVRRSDWKKPTDDAYSFRLRPHDRFVTRVPPPGVRSDIREVARIALDEGESARFEKRIARWSGPEDVAPDGSHPYESPQNVFVERSNTAPLTMGDVRCVLSGEVLVMRGGGPIDLVMRDHHMLDAALYLWATSGELPRRLFHADRHSDWCRDSFLEARQPDQAATWWKLVEGLKRPGSGAPVLREEDVVFTTARAKASSVEGARDLDKPQPWPWFLSEKDLDWQAALERDGATDCDWVSIDLDDFQPRAQLRMTRGLVRDARFRSMLAKAKVRVFVLSPQFTRGGDKIASWTVQGRMHSTLRLLNLFRSIRDSA